MSFYQRFNQPVQFCHKYTFLRTSMPCNVWSSKTTACWVSLHLKYNNSSISYVCLQFLQLYGDYQKQNDAKNNNNNKTGVKFTTCFKSLVFGLLFDGHVRRWCRRGLWVAVISGKLSHVIGPLPEVLLKERMCIRRGNKPRVTAVTLRGQEVLFGFRV